MRKAQKILLYGALGRHNFGDLLFPVIVKRLLKSVIDYQKYEIITCALTKGDLGIYGADSSQDLYSVVSEIDEPVKLIHVGGETLGCTSEYALSMALPSPIGSRFITTKKIGLRAKKNLFKNLTGLNFDYPYVIPKRFLPVGSKVAFNGVGGSGLNLSGWNKRELKERYKNADFLGVRDFKTKEILMGENIQSQLMPDSGVLVKELFETDNKNKSKENIAKLIRPFIKSGYVVVQVNRIINPQSFKVIANGITKLCREYKLSCVVLPLGYAALHEDISSCVELSKHLKDINTIVVTDIDIWDMLFTLSRAKLFVGTSLHGRIVATSYSIPRVSLKFIDPKISSYADTWDLATQSGETKPSELYKCAKVALSESKRNLDQVATHLPKIYKEKFDLMCRTIGL